MGTAREDKKEVAMMKEQSGTVVTVLILVPMTQQKHSVTVSPRVKHITLFRHHSFISRYPEMMTLSRLLTIAYFLKHRPLLGVFHYSRS